MDKIISVEELVDTTYMDADVVRDMEEIEDELVRRTTALYASSPSAAISEVKEMMREPTTVRFTNVVHLIALLADEELLAKAQEIMRRYEIED